MRKKNLIPALFLLVWMVGCSSSKTSVNPTLTIIDMPPVGDVVVAELGETLVQKGKVYQYDAIDLHNTVQAGDGFLLKKLTLNPGLLRASMKDTKRTYYTTEKLYVYDALLGTKMELGGLAISDSDPAEIKFHLNGKRVMRPKPNPDYVKTKAIAYERPSFRQELIYNGKTGDFVKFLYREFSGDMMRPPFSQEIQYDLRDGNLIGFKGVRIDVISATNTNIKYKVIASFPDMP